MSRFGGVNASLRELSTEGVGGQASGEKIETLGDIQEVGLSGIFAFEDFNPEKPKTYTGGDGGLKAAEMDEEEKAFAKKVRMARMADVLANIEAKKTVVEKVAEKVVKSDCDEKKGVRGVVLASRANAFSKVNRLVLEASKKTLEAFGEEKKPKRRTLEYSLKHDQKTIRVAFHEHVQSFLYSQNPGEKEFLDGFYLDLKQKSSQSKPGSKAERFRKGHEMEWTYHDWGSGKVCIVPQNEGEGGGKKRKSGDEGRGKSGKKKRVG